MKMTPLILMILGVSGVYGDSHTLRYYESGVSSPGFGLPEYSEVGYVDDREISNYNSDTRQYLPSTEWMKKVGSDDWERETQTGQHNEAVYKQRVQILMKRFNQTGDPPSNGLPVAVNIGVVIGILAVIITVVLLIKKNKTGYKSTNTSDTASDNSRK